MDEIVKHINDTNASYRQLNAGDAKNTDLFLDNDQYQFFEGFGEQITVRFDKENLTKAMLFIASILPRKFDQSAIHKVVSFSKEFVLDQLSILDALFSENGISVNTITQIWNARKDVPKKNGEVDKRFYFNGLLKDISYKDHAGVIQQDKFTIRNYLAGGYSDLHITKAEDGIFDVRVENTTTYLNDGKENGLEEIEEVIKPIASLQQIFYGAPGTGKSHTINEVTKGEDVIRTTFHPDTDYSGFVGAYKPTTSLLPICNELGEPMKIANQALYKEQIVYEFVAQSFLQAYIAAWKKYTVVGQDEPKKQFLVIEEINRGNCAQIFGDLFVAHAVRHHADHFAFALRELHQAAAEGRQFHFGAAVIEVIHHGAADGGQKTLIVDGLLQEVDLSANVRTVGDAAFYLSSVSKAIIGDQVEVIGSGAFEVENPLVIECLFFEDKGWQDWYLDHNTEITYLPLPEENA